MSDNSNKYAVRASAAPSLWGRAGGEALHIAIAGNIGSGKTTLTRMLAKHYGWEVKFEKVVENPYLADYYKDIKRWSFNMEVYFLKERFKDILEITKAENTVIQDRSIFEGVYVFAKNNHEQGAISDRDFESYMDLFDNMISIVKEPYLMIYLRADIKHLVHNIQKRGRDYEQQIQLDYLKGLNNRYEDFIYKDYKGKVLTIDVNDMDYEHNPQDFRKITDEIDQLLYGLWPLKASPQPSPVGRELHAGCDVSQ